MSYNPEIHTGGEGTFVANAVDWNVSKWSGKFNKTAVDITTTGNFDSATGITWGEKKVTMMDFTWTAEIFRDGNNDIIPGLISPANITNVVLTSYTGHTVSMAKALVTGIDYDTGGTAGVNKATITGNSQGKVVVT